MQLSKERPGGLSFSTAGYGLLQHLAVEEMARRAGAKFTHVVYKGGAQAVDRPRRGAGRFRQFRRRLHDPVRAERGSSSRLGVIAGEPARRLLPDVPTTAEQGLPGLDAGVHFMLYAPAATPEGRRRDPQYRTQQARAAIHALKERFADIGYDPTAISPETGGRHHAQDRRAWAPLIKRLNIKLD